MQATPCHATLDTATARHESSNYCVDAPFIKVDDKVDVLDAGGWGASEMQHVKHNYDHRLKILFLVTWLCPLLRHKYCAIPL
jgi:hypothetical protein